MDLVLHLDRSSLDTIRDRILTIMSDRKLQTATSTSELNNDILFSASCYENKGFDLTDPVVQKHLNNVPKKVFVIAMVEELLKSNKYLDELRSNPNLDEFLMPAEPTSKKDGKISNSSIADGMKRLKKLVVKLCILWDLVDVDIRGVLNWIDFTNFCIRVGRLHFKESIKQTSLVFSEVAASHAALPIYKFFYIPSLNFVLSYDTETPTLRFFTKYNRLHGTLNLTKDFLQLIHPRTQFNQIPHSKRALFIHSKQKIAEYHPPEKLKITCLTVVDSLHCIVMSMSNAHLVKLHYRISEETLFGAFKPHHYEMNSFISTGHQQSGMTFSYRYQLLITWSGFGGEHKFRLWNISSDCIKESFEIFVHESLVVDLCEVESEQGHYMASCSTDRKVLLWEIYFEYDHYNRSNEGDQNPPIRRLRGMQGTNREESRKISRVQKYELHGHIHGIKKLIFAPQSAVLIGSGFDFEVYIWDPFSQIILYKLDGHLAELVGITLVYTPGEHLVSLDQGGIVKVWRLGRGSDSKGQLLQTIVLDGVLSQATSSNSGTGSGAKSGVDGSNSNDHVHVHDVAVGFDQGRSFVVRADRLYAFAADDNMNRDLCPIKNGLFATNFTANKLITVSNRIISQYALNSGMLGKKLFFLDKDVSDIYHDSSSVEFKETVREKPASKDTSQKEKGKQDLLGSKSWTKIKTEDIINNITNGESNKSRVINNKVAVNFLKVFPDDSILCSAFDEAGKKLFVGTLLGHIYFYDVATLSILCDFSLFNDSADGLSASGNNIEKQINVLRAIEKPNERPGKSEKKTEHLRHDSSTMEKSFVVGLHYVDSDGLLVALLSNGMVRIYSAIYRFMDDDNINQTQAHSDPHHHDFEQRAHQHDLSPNPPPQPILLRQTTYALCGDNTAAHLAVSEQTDTLVVGLSTQKIFVFEYCSLLLKTSLQLPKASKLAISRSIDRKGFVEMAAHQEREEQRTNETSQLAQSVSISSMTIFRKLPILIVSDSIGRLSLYRLDSAHEAWILTWYPWLCPALDDLKEKVQEVKPPKVYDIAALDDEDEKELSIDSFSNIHRVCEYFIPMESNIEVKSKQQPHDLVGRFCIAFSNKHGTMIIQDVSKVLAKLGFVALSESIEQNKVTESLEHKETHHQRKSHRHSRHHSHHRNHQHEESEEDNSQHPNPTLQALLADYPQNYRLLHGPVSQHHTSVFRYTVARRTAYSDGCQGQPIALKRLQSSLVHPLGAQDVDTLPNLSRHSKGHAMPKEKANHGKDHEHHLTSSTIHNPTSSSEAAIGHTDEAVNSKDVANDNRQLSPSKSLSAKNKFTAAVLTIAAITKKIRPQNRQMIANNIVTVSKIFDVYNGKIVEIFVPRHQNALYFIAFENGIVQCRDFKTHVILGETFDANMNAPTSNPTLAKGNSFKRRIWEPIITDIFKRHPSYIFHKSHDSKTNICGDKLGLAFVEDVMQDVKEHIAVLSNLPRTNAVTIQNQNQLNNAELVDFGQIDNFASVHTVPNIMQNPSTYGPSVTLTAPNSMTTIRNAMAAKNLIGGDQSRADQSTVNLSSVFQSSKLKKIVTDFPVWKDALSDDLYVFSDGHKHVSGVEKLASKFDKIMSGYQIRDALTGDSLSESKDNNSQYRLHSSTHDMAHIGHEYEVNHLHNLVELQHIDHNKCHNEHFEHMIEDLQILDGDHPTLKHEHHGHQAHAVPRESILHPTTENRRSSRPTSAPSHRRSSTPKLDVATEDHSNSFKTSGKNTTFVSKIRNLSGNEASTTPRHHANTLHNMNILDEIITKCDDNYQMKTQRPASAHAIKKQRSIPASPQSQNAKSLIPDDETGDGDIEFAFQDIPNVEDVMQAIESEQGKEVDEEVYLKARLSELASMFSKKLDEGKSAGICTFNRKTVKSHYAHLNGTVQKGDMNKFKEVAKGPKLVHNVDLHHNVDRFGPYKTTDIWSVTGLIHKLAVQELIRRTKNVNIDDIDMMEYQDRASEMIANELLRFHSTVLTRSPEIGHLEDLIDVVIEKCEKNIDYSLSLEELVEVFFPHTSVSSRMRIVKFMKFSLLLREIFARAKIKVFDDVFHARNKTKSSVIILGFMTLKEPPHISRGFQGWEISRKSLAQVSELIDLWTHQKDGGLYISDFIEIIQSMVSPFFLTQCRPLLMLGKLIQIRLKKRTKTDINSMTMVKILDQVMKMTITD